MCRLRNIALESVTEKCDRQTHRWTTGRTDRQTDGQTTDKVIPMCRYASQATQKTNLICLNFITKLPKSYHNGSN